MDAVKNSVQLTKKLKEKAVQLNLSYKKLIIDVATRWNSTHDMLNRFLDLYEALKLT